MKNLMNQTLAAAALVGALLASVTSTSSANPTPATLSLTWGFGTAANPAPPDSATGVTGSPLAVIAPGQFAEGWFDQMLGLPGASGAWDLGNAGSITLNNASGLGGPADQARNITVKVVQYYDSGGFYDEHTTVSVPGAVLTSTSVSIFSPSGNFGDWVVQETHWTAAAGTPVNSIVINGATSPKKGSVIDQVMVQSSAAGAAGAQLSIRKSGTAENLVEISWSADYAGMVLEANSDLSDGNGWSAVPTAPQLSGGTYSVTVEATGAKFYRLKQP
jgi:hypothetical protein